MGKTMYDLTPDLIDSFREWNAKEPTRTVNIRFGTKGGLDIYVYDTRLDMIQHVGKPEDINLEGEIFKAQQFDILHEQYKAGNLREDSESYKFLKDYYRILGEERMNDLAGETKANYYDIIERQIQRQIERESRKETAATQPQ